jgi:hypothetical protein
MFLFAGFGNSVLAKFFEVLSLKAETNNSFKGEYHV